MKTFFATLTLLFVAFASYSQQFVINGSYDKENAYPYISLINMSDNSIEWEGEASDGKFSITTEKGDYVLCFNGGVDYSTYYLPINLASDVTLEEIAPLLKDEIAMSQTFPYDEFMNGFDTEMQGEVTRFYIFPHSLKGKNMLIALNFIYINDFRVEKTSKYIATFEIDGVRFEKDIWELVQYLQTLSRDDLDYIEKQPPTEQFPGGIIRIKTNAYEYPSVDDSGVETFKIKGSVEYKNGMSLVRVHDNSVVWVGKVFTKRHFSIPVESGDYVLCVPYSYCATYLPVNVRDGDIDLGELQFDISRKLPVDELFAQKYEEEKIGDVQRYVLKPNTKKYSILSVLNMVNIYDFRAFFTMNLGNVGTVEIDGVAINKNLLDMAKYLDSLPAKHVKYIEKHAHTEQSPGGVIRIVTSASDK